MWCYNDSVRSTAKRNVFVRNATKHHDKHIPRRAKARENIVSHLGLIVKPQKEGVRFFMSKKRPSPLNLEEEILEKHEDDSDDSKDTSREKEDAKKIKDDDDFFRPVLF